MSGGQAAPGAQAAGATAGAARPGPPQAAAAPASPGRQWQVSDCLTWTQTYFAGRRLATPRLDAEVLLAHVLGIGRTGLYTHPERPLDPGEREALRGLVKRRAVGEPIAYIVGEREFWGRPFKVDPRVLIPRPETEHLVEVGLAHLRAAPPTAAAPQVLEIGCGSGAVAISLALDAPEVAVCASDISPAALAVARENALALAPEALADSRLRLVEADLLAGAACGVGLIVANLPYVAASEAQALPVDVRDFEPGLALFGGDDGLALLAALVAAAPAHLAPGGLLAVEMGAQQAQAVREMFAANPGWGPPAVVPDLQGHPRIAHAAWRREGI